MPAEELLPAAALHLGRLGLFWLIVGQELVAVVAANERAGLARTVLAHHAVFVYTLVRPLDRAHRLVGAWLLCRRHTVATVVPVRHGLTHTYARYSRCVCFSPRTGV